MDMLEPVILPLQLRRDRGYVYFPDAVVSCLAQFGLESGNIRAECYKISDRQICTEEIKGGVIRTPEIFGSIVFNNERRFVLREQAATNQARYDLFEPLFDFEMNLKEITVRAEQTFPSLFHRWAVCCKKLYHHADPDPGRRMLLQRFQTFSPTENTDETFKLEFMTPERFMKFGVFQNGNRVGEVIAAAKEMS